MQSQAGAVHGRGASARAAGRSPCWRPPLCSTRGRKHKRAVNSHTVSVYAVRRSKYRRAGAQRPRRALDASVPHRSARLSSSAHTPRSAQAHIRSRQATQGRDVEGGTRRAVRTCAATFRTLSVRDCCATAAVAPSTHRCAGTALRTQTTADRGTRTRGARLRSAMASLAALAWYARGAALKPSRAALSAWTADPASREQLAVALVHEGLEAAVAAGGSRAAARRRSIWWRRARCLRRKTGAMPPRALHVTPLARPPGAASPLCRATQAARGLRTEAPLVATDSKEKPAQPPP